MSDSNLPVRVVEGEWRYDRDRYVRALPALDAAPMFGGVACINAISGLIHGWWLQFFVFGALGLGMIVNRLVRRKRAMKLIRAIVPSGSVMEPGQLGLVHLQFFRDGVHFGDDMGMLAIDEHYLHFEGVQTSFSTAGWRLDRMDNQFSFIDRPDLRVTMRKIETSRKATHNLPVADTRRVLSAEFTPDSEVSELIVGLPPTTPIRDSTRLMKLRLAGWYATVPAFMLAGIYMIVFLYEPRHAFFRIALGSLMVFMAVVFPRSMILDIKQSLAAFARWKAEDSR